MWIAIFVSVTVSIGLDMNGVLSATLRGGQGLYFFVKQRAYLRVMRVSVATSDA